MQLRPLIVIVLHGFWHVGGRSTKKPSKLQKNKKQKKQNQQLVPEEKNKQTKKTKKNKLNTRLQRSRGARKPVSQRTEGPRASVSSDSLASWLPGFLALWSLVLSFFVFFVFWKYKKNKQQKNKTMESSVL